MFLISPYNNYFCIPCWVLVSIMLGTFYEALCPGVLYIGHKLINTLPISVISWYYYFNIEVKNLRNDMDDKRNTFNTATKKHKNKVWKSLLISCSFDEALRTFHQILRLAHNLYTSLHKCHPNLISSRLTAEWDNLKGSSVILAYRQVM